MWYKNYLIEYIEYKIHALYEALILKLTIYNISTHQQYVLTDWWNDILWPKGNGCQRRTEQPLSNSNVAAGRLRFPDQSQRPISQSLGVDPPSRV